MREKYQKSIGSGYGLANSTEWLEDEDEILAKMPLLDRNNIKVSDRIRDLLTKRDGKVFGTGMVDGLQLGNLSMLWVCI